MQADKSDFSEGNGEFARQRAVELECKAVLLALNERQDEGQADSRGLTVLHSWLDLGYVPWFVCPVLVSMSFSGFGLPSYAILFHVFCYCRILNAGQTATATLELRAARAGIHCLAHLFVVRISVGADAEPAPCGRRGLEVFAASDLIEVQCD